MRNWVAVFRNYGSQCNRSYAVTASQFDRNETYGLTKDNIIRFIKNNHLCLIFLNSKSSSAQVWSSLSYVYFNNYKQNFVTYDNYKETLHYKSCNGTSGMAKLIAKLYLITPNIKLLKNVFVPQ